MHFLSSLAQDPIEAPLGAGASQKVRLENPRLTERSTLLITATPCTDVVGAAPLLTSVKLNLPYAEIYIAASDATEPCKELWELRWLLVNGV